MPIDSLTITLPLPDPTLNGHAKGHWRAKRGPTRLAKEAAQLAAIAALGGRQSPNWPRAVLSIAVYYADNARRDVLNTVNALKAAIDGIVDAGILADDRWQVMRIGAIDADIDRENPRVELTVRKDHE